MKSGLLQFYNGTRFRRRCSHAGMFQSRAKCHRPGARINCKSDAAPSCRFSAGTSRSSHAPKGLAWDGRRERQVSDLTVAQARVVLRAYAGGWPKLSPAPPATASYTCRTPDDAQHAFTDRQLTGWVYTSTQGLCPVLLIAINTKSAPKSQGSRWRCRWPHGRSCDTPWWPCDTYPWSSSDFFPIGVYLFDCCAYCC